MDAKPAFPVLVHLIVVDAASSFLMAVGAAKQFGGVDILPPGILVPAFAPLFIGLGAVMVAWATWCIVRIALDKARGSGD